jgi:hypothetical protein
MLAAAQASVNAFLFSLNKLILSVQISVMNTGLKKRKWERERERERGGNKDLVLVPVATTSRVAILAGLTLAALIGTVALVVDAQKVQISLGLLIATAALVSLPLTCSAAVAACFRSTATSVGARPTSLFLSLLLLGLLLLCIATIQIVSNGSSAECLLVDEVELEAAEEDDELDRFPGSPSSSLSHNLTETTEDSLSLSLSYCSAIERSLSEAVLAVLAGGVGVFLQCLELRRLRGT